MFIFFIFYLVCLLFVIRYKETALIWMPVFTILVDVLPLYITGEAVGQGQNVIVLQYFRGFIFLLIFIYYLTKTSNRSYFLTFNIGLYIFYILLRQLLTSDIYSNIKIALLLSTYIMFIPISYSYTFHYKVTFSKLKIVIIISLTIFLLNVLFSTLFYGIQEKQYYYLNSIINLGSFNLLSQYGIVYLNLFLLAHLRLLKRLDIFLIVTSIIVVILTGKRTPLYIIVSGFFIIGYFHRHYLFKFVRLKSIFLIIVLFVTTFVSYQYTQKNVRTEMGELSYSQTGRYNEFIAIYTELVYYGDMFSVFTGHYDSFSARFSKAVNPQLDITEERTIHSDIAIILFSSGLFGLFFYVTILWSIFLKQLRLSKLLENSNATVAFYSIYFGLVINLFADSHTVATARIIPYMLLGISLGLQQRNLYHKVKGG